MAKRKKRFFISGKNKTILAHKFGMGGSISNETLGETILSYFRWQCTWQEAITKCIIDKPSVTGIKPFEKKPKDIFAYYPSTIKSAELQTTSDPNEFVKTDAFLQTYEWRKLRLEALKLYGAKCQCCGATPDSGSVMNVDHIKPRKFFPELARDLDNLQILCHECNHGKGNWDTTDWRK